MKISNIYASNIDDFLTMICVGKTDKDRRKDIGSHIIDMYHHMSLSFEIEEINILEAFFLKKISNHNILTLETIEGEELIDTSKFKEMHHEVVSLLKLLEVIKKDPDTPSFEGTEMLPLICLQKKIIVTFTGPSLSIILTPQPDNMLQEIYHFKNDESFDINHIRNNMDDFYNQCTLNLVNQFYKNFLNWGLSMDLLVDATIDQNYYSYVNRDTTELAEVFTPFGSLHFMGESVTNEILSKQINRTKEGFQSLPNIYKDKMYSETKLNFIISSSLYAFLEMYLALPNHFFLDMMDFKRVLISKDVDRLITGKYDIRLNSHETKLIKERDKIVENPTYKIEKYFFGFLGSEIKFSFSVSLEEISLFLQNYRNNILLDNIYGKNLKSFLVCDIVKILTEIETKAKMIHQILFS